MFKFYAELILFFETVDSCLTQLFQNPESLFENVLDNYAPVFTFNYNGAKVVVNGGICPGQLNQDTELVNDIIVELLGELDA